MSDTEAEGEAPRKAYNATRPHPWIERAEYAAILFGMALLLPLPRTWRTGFAGWLSATLGPRLWFARRAYQNLEDMRPDLSRADHRAIVAGMCANFARTGVEYLAAPALAAAAPSFKVVGLDRLLEARAAAGGRAVVASAHFGNWEAIRAVAAHHGAPLAIIYRAFNNQLAEDLFRRHLLATGWPAFRKGAVGGRALFKHVRGGGGAMILVDQRAGGAPVLDFLGRPAETSLAAAQLARSLKAPLVPAVAFRRVGGRFEVRFEEPIPTGTPLEMMQTLNDHIGAWIKEDPSQWFWLHRRWRIRGEIGPGADRSSARRVYAREIADRGGAPGG